MTFLVMVRSEDVGGGVCANVVLDDYLVDDDDGFDVSINDDDCFDEDCVNHVLVDEYFSTEEMSGAGLFCPVSNASSHLQEVACTRFIDRLGHFLFLSPQH